MAPTRVAGGAMAAVVLAYACGESTSPVLDIPASLTLIPSVMTMTSLGETQTLNATVRDALGNELDSTVTFVSTASGIASVDAAGVVTAVGIGITEVTATVGTLTRTSEIRVSQVGTRLDKTLGDDQSAVVGSTLPDPLTLTITDAGGNGVAGIFVTFTVSGGGGSITVDTMTTGADGVASTSFTIGTTSGAIHTVQALAAGVGQVEFRATGLADAPDAAAIAAGDNQVQPALSTLPIALTVRVADQFNNGVPGETVQFTVSGGGGSLSATSVNTDANGEARTNWTLGSTIGAQTVDADVAGVTSTPLVFTADGTNLSITDVVGDSLREGMAGQIVGTGFSSVAAEVQVTIDGFSAAITGSTPTTIDFTVPTTSCRPARDVGVSVTTVSGGTTPDTMEPLAPGNFVSIAQGAQVIISDPNDFCFQFDRLVADEEYLIGVQSIRTSGNALSRMSVRGAIPGGASPARGAVASAPPPVGPSLDAVTAARLERWARHRDAETALRLAERLYVPTGPASNPRLPSGPAMASSAIPGDVSVGTSVNLKVPDVAGNLCTDFTDVTGTVMAVGTRGIWVNDNNNPSNGYSSADYNTLSDLLDDFVFDADTAMFGTPTDLDGNDRFVILMTQVINTTNGNILGFVSTGDVRSPISCPASNEAEIYYGKPPDPGATGGFVYTRDQAFEDAPPVIAHEITHIIQGGRRFVGAGESLFLQPFIAEGQATLAEEAAGHAATGHAPRTNLTFTVGFNSDGSEPHTWYAFGLSDLGNYFGANGTSTSREGAPHECAWLSGNPAPCQGRSLWYGVAWSFLRWVNDQFPGMGPGFQKDIIVGSERGLDAIDMVVPEPLETLLAQWAASLYTDNRGISGLDPRLNFPSWHLRNIYDSGNLSASAALEVNAQTFATFQQTVDVRPANTAYFLISGANRPPTAVRVRDAVDGILTTDTQIFLVRTR